MFTAAFSERRIFLAAAFVSFIFGSSLGALTARAGLLAALLTTLSGSLLSALLVLRIALAFALTAGSFLSFSIVCHIFNLPLFVFYLESIDEFRVLSPHPQRH